MLEYECTCIIHLLEALHLVEALYLVGVEALDLEEALHLADTPSKRPKVPRDH